MKAHHLRLQGLQNSSVALQSASAGDAGSDAEGAHVIPDVILEAHCLERRILKLVQLYS